MLKHITQTQVYANLPAICYAEDMSEIKTMTKRDAAILYRMHAQDHLRSIKTFKSLGMEVPGMEEAYRRTAEYAEGVASELEKAPNESIQVEMDLMYVMDIVAFREKATDECVKEPLMASLRNRPM